VKGQRQRREVRGAVEGRVWKGVSPFHRGSGLGRVLCPSPDFYIRQVNGVKLGVYTVFTFVCLSVCLSVICVHTQCHWFEWAE